jgi:2-amino-4-hydroxy-6-hydroxymethyldihydropteridine diphosphokinase
MNEIRIAYLSIGSNLGDRVATLRSALDELSRAGIPVARTSPVYETEPIGCPEQPWFLNMAAAVQTDMPPRALLSCCLDIEARHGRIRPFPGAPRTLDLDILLIENLILDEPDLTIPHPRMTQRRFVLVPLSDIAPEAFHPVSKEAIRSLLASCPDASKVVRYLEMI